MALPLLFVDSYRGLAICDAQRNEPHFITKSLIFSVFLYILSGISNKSVA
jgi:hypothetical protein